MGVFTFFAVWQISRWIGWLTVIPSPIELAAGVPGRTEGDS